MHCPKCESDFQAITYEDIEVDRCAGCGGLWFDAYELRELQRIKGARRIDVGTERAGSKNNEIRNVQCPRCDVPMLTMVDAVQTHITIESCPDCHGTYLDAGEFRDLSELTVTERVRHMIDNWLTVS